MRRSQLSALPTNVTGTSSDRETPRSGPLRTISSPARGSAHVEDCLSILFGLPTNSIEMPGLRVLGNLRERRGSFAEELKGRAGSVSDGSESLRPLTPPARQDRHPATVLSIWASSASPRSPVID